ncbi:MAG: hypothetical protein PHI83_05765 [Sphaerochaetaceae bacterium]|nr:hypothetical protein [Sphaerochaetaceae bacterium]
MKRVLASILVLCIALSLSYANELPAYTPYEASEFPQWAHDLRRGETLFFGSLPLAYPVVSLALSAFKADLGFWPTIGISAGIALSIAITDYILGIINEK